MLTAEDHSYLYENLRRHEIINGEHFQQTAGTPRHQLIVGNETQRVDEIVKRHAYERCGVGEYWVIDPLLEVVKIYRLFDGAYQRVAEVSTESGGAIASPLLGDVTLDVAELFDTAY